MEVTGLILNIVGVAILAWAQTDWMRQFVWRYWRMISALKP
jgi:hypothetical protein